LHQNQCIPKAKEAWVFEKKIKHDIVVYSDYVKLLMSANHFKILEWFLPSLFDRRQQKMREGIKP